MGWYEYKPATGAIALCGYCGWTYDVVHGHSCMPLIATSGTGPAPNRWPVAGPPNHDRLIAHAQTLRRMATDPTGYHAHRNTEALQAGAAALERLDEVRRAARAFLGAFDHASSHAEVIETAAALETVLAKGGDP